jgi:hypothetical protein
LEKTPISYSSQVKQKLRRTTPLDIYNNYKDRPVGTTTSRHNEPKLSTIRPLLRGNQSPGHKQWPLYFPSDIPWRTTLLRLMSNNGKIRSRIPKCRVDRSTQPEPKVCVYVKLRTSNMLDCDFSSGVRPLVYMHSETLGISDEVCF